MTNPLAESVVAAFTDLINLAGLSQITYMILEVDLAEEERVRDERLAEQVVLGPARKHGYNNKRYDEWKDYFYSQRYSDQGKVPKAPQTICPHSRLLPKEVGK